MTADTRTALVDAALTELGESGQAGISLRAVARRAGVSHAAPKNHFPDRAALLTAAAVRGYDDLAVRVDAADATGADAPPEDRLAAMAGAYLDFGLERPALLDLMFRLSELRPDDDLARAQAASIRSLERTATTLGARHGLGPRTATLMAWSLVHGLVGLAREGLLGADRDQAADTAREVAAAFARTLASRSS